MYQAPKAGSKIIIVGAGCFGLSTAYSLSLDKEKNYDIWVYDRGSIPISDAASTDISKAVRIDYGSSKMYMQLAIEAIDEWNKWNIERSKQGLGPIYHNTGVLVMATNSRFTDNEINSIKNIKEAGHSNYIEELTAEQIKNRYPFLTEAVGKGYDIAYVNNVGGWCNSSESIKYLYDKCLENDVHFVLGKEKGCFNDIINDPQHPKSVVGIKTKDGRTHYCDQLVLATGSWTPSIINMHRQVLASGQIVVHFKLSKKDQEVLKTLPVWIADASRKGFYGFPYCHDGILKIAKHSPVGYLNPRGGDQVSVPRTQSTNVQDTIPLVALKEFRQFLNEFLPLTSSLDIVYSRVCWYSDSIDGGFVIGPHPDFDNLIVATGDSGHGMKFFPIIGHKIRDVIECRDTEYAKFWAWREKEAQDGFFDRPTLVQEGSENFRMAVLEELKANT